MQHHTLTITTDGNGNGQGVLSGLTGFIHAYQFARQQLAGGAGTIQAVALKPVEIVFSLAIPASVSVTAYPVKQCSNSSGFTVASFTRIPLADDQIAVTVDSATPNKSCTVEFWIE